MHGAFSGKEGTISSRPVPDPSLPQGTAGQNPLVQNAWDLPPPFLPCNGKGRMKLCVLSFSGLATADLPNLEDKQIKDMEGPIASSKLFILTSRQVS